MLHLSKDSELFDSLQAGNMPVAASCVSVALMLAQLAHLTTSSSTASSSESSRWLGRALEGDSLNTFLSIHLSCMRILDRITRETSASVMDFAGVLSAVEEELQVRFPWS